jgi:hypothetical protein
MDTNMPDLKGNTYQINILLNGGKIYPRFLQFLYNKTKLLVEVIIFFGRCEYLSKSVLKKYSSSEQ